MSIFDLPDEIISDIIRKLDSNTKREFSLMNKCMNAFLYSTTREIGLLSPYRGMKPGVYLLNIPVDILVNIICRYPHLEKINFGFSRQGSFSNEGEFYDELDKIYLEELISYLNNHPLINVKKINFKEIIYYTDFNKDSTVSLNYRLLNSLGSNILEDVYIKAYHMESCINGTQIQGILEKSPSLKIFKFDGFLSNMTVDLSFNKLQYLRKVKLTHWSSNHTTIESLKECKHLQELVVRSKNTYLPKELENIFSNQSWYLKRLELPDLSIRSDTSLDKFVKSLPQLECFSITLENISDEGMSIIGINCPNLKIFQCKNKNLTNLGLASLTSHLPQLEIIDLSFSYNITEIGIEFIAKNCTNLQLISIINCNETCHIVVDVLIKYCKDLKAISFGYGGRIDIQDIYRMVNCIPSLLYVDIRSATSTGIRPIKDFYQSCPTIKRFPYISNANKLRKLIL